MRKLVISSLMLLGFAGSALGQHRIVKLNSRQVQGQEPKADSIIVVWDDGEGKRRFTSIFSQGPVRFVTEDSPSPFHQLPPWQFVTKDLPSKDTPVRFFAPLPETEAGSAADTILEYQTTLIQVGPSAIHYSRELGNTLKIVTSKNGAMEISEAVSIDQQADFDPRTVDLSGIEEAAANAEAAGQKDYARQIMVVGEALKQAAPNWP